MDYYEKRPAVYVMRHLPSGVFYVGSTKNLNQRFRWHRYELKAGIHKAKLLQGVFTSWDDVHVDFRYMDDKETALDFEQSLLDLVYGLPGCANSSNCSRNNHVVLHTPEARSKISLSLRGRVHTKEAISKQIAGRNKRISIDGIEYPSVKAAAETLGVTSGAISQGLKSSSPRREKWRYLTS